MVKKGTEEVNPSQEKLSSAFLTGSSLNWTLQEIAEEITSRAGIIHAVERKTTCFEIYFFQEEERNKFVERKEICNRDRVLQISLPQETSKYFITGVPKKMTKKEIMKLLSKQVKFIKIALIRETKAQIFTGTVQISVLANDTIPKELILLGRKYTITNQKEQKKKEQKDMKQPQEQLDTQHNKTENENIQKDIIPEVIKSDTERLKNETNEIKTQGIENTFQETPKKKKKNRKRKTITPENSPPHKVEDTKPEDFVFTEIKCFKAYVQCKDSTLSSLVVDAVFNKTKEIHGIKWKKDAFTLYFRNEESQRKIIKEESIQIKNKKLLVMRERTIGNS